MTNRYNALTAKWLTKNGWQHDNSEKPYNRFCKVRKDLCGFMDRLAFRHMNENLEDGIVGFKEIAGVQSTSGANHTARRKKILSLPMALGWLKAGGLILLISWRKGASKRVLKSGRISERKVWIPRVETITEADFEAKRQSSARGGL